jgi:hypothetical protein
MAKQYGCGMNRSAGDVVTSAGLQFGFSGKTGGVDQLIIYVVAVIGPPASRCGMYVARSVCWTWQDGCILCIAWL